MEHRLVLGGEIYLPFARSRIKALRATGLVYASQQFEIDGCSVKVRIEPGHEYISLGGGQCVLDMESGVVDLHSDNPNRPEFYQPGTLHETDSVAAYHAAFAAESGDYYRTNPRKGSAGQLAGSVTYTAGEKGFRGKVAPNPSASRAFSPGSERVGDPPMQADKARDEMLAVKKLLAITCPPSIFTGKCRLYVQALYGTPLYAGVKRDGITINGDMPSASPVAYPGQPPYLMVPSYRDKGSSASLPEVVIATGAGVFLDKQTGKHWLFVPTAYDITVYPLMSSPCGERLRKYLASESGKKEATELDAEDREHLEAYILADSLPDVAKGQVAAGAISPLSTWSMGYSWHWNWSGTTADMIVSLEFQQPFDMGRDNYAMRSVHYRLAMTRVLPEPTAPGGTPAKWSVAFQTVNDREWSVPRLFWCVTEPDWPSRGQAKVTPKYTTLFDCSADFYAFYVRDTLHLCNVTAAFVEPGSPTRKRSDALFAPETPFSGISGFTWGMRDGFIEDLRPAGRHFAGTFTCGPCTTGLLAIGKNSDGRRVEVNKKAAASAVRSSGTSGVIASDTVEFGYPDDAGVWPTAPAVRPYTVQTQDGSTGVTYTIEAGSFSEQIIGLAVVAVAVDDAEAVYMQADISTTKSKREWFSQTRHTVRSYMSFSHVAHYVPPTNPQDAGTFVDGASYTKYIGGDLLHLSDDTVIDPNAQSEDSTIVTTATPTSHLVSRAGARRVIFSSTDQFHSTEFEVVQQNYSALSATRVDKPTVIAVGRAEPIGFFANIDTPALVGWI